jgi:hypothetical protein
MATQNYPIDYESLRTEIEAAIAAGRELDPSMDKHLASSIVERFSSSQPKISVSQIQVLPHHYVAIDRLVLRPASLLISAGVIILLIASNLWWMFWLLIPLLAMLAAVFGRSNSGRRKTIYREPSMRQQYKEAQMRYKLEKLEAKRALIKGVKSFSEGFTSGFHDKK